MKKEKELRSKLHSDALKLVLNTVLFLMTLINKKIWCFSLISTEWFDQLTPKIFKKKSRIYYQFSVIYLSKLGYKLRTNWFLARLINLTNQKPSLVIAHD